MMVKQTIDIQKIKNETLHPQTDEVAVEEKVEIKLENGCVMSVICTPSYIEEMVLSKRFLAGEITQEETEDEPLESVSLKEIFSIAQDSFEQPGPLFTDTGCAHSCALVHKGEVLCCIEDIGRHNALDKVIGYALKHHISIKNSYVFTSGRVSGDYLEKVIGAGFPMVVSRAAVTHNAAVMAREKQITLLGFIRKHAGNLYNEGKVKIHE